MKGGAWVQGWISPGANPCGIIAWRAARPGVEAELSTFGDGGVVMVEGGFRARNQVDRVSASLRA